jgi:threonylcarbamoyladenosine tRNA methylthiotransferase MtaB
VRLGSLEPGIITEEFIERLRGIPEICPHFHLSLQSGCDSVLKRMNRHYTTQEYKESLSLLRSAFDRPAITTDVIVGFPGETEDEFACTRQFLEEIQLYETHLFRYSMRAGTKAARMEGQIPEPVKEERLSRLQAIDRRMREIFEQRWEDQKAEVLFEELAQVDGNGRLSAPNSGAARKNPAMTVTASPGQEKLYTGYTREYIRIYARSSEDLRGQIRSGRMGRRNQFFPDELSSG